MILKLIRFQYSETETMGVLVLPTPLFTIERPWIPAKGHKGGLPFKSCIPDGIYRMAPFNSEKHRDTWVLRNSVLDVYGSPDEVPRSGGRYTCLFHVGNFVDNVEGCIAPGISRVIMKDRDGVYQNAVASSRTAMDLLRNVLKSRSDNEHFLDISNSDGTSGALPWLSQY